MKRTILFLLLSTLGSAAFAGNFLCSTGFAASGTSGCGPAINSPSSNNLTADGNWYVASNTSGTFLSQAFVTINNSFPVQNAGPWLANNANDVNGIGAGSSWIVPSNNQAQAYINNAYYFSTQFNVAANQASTASISGYWLADDYGGGVFLNGVTVNQASLPIFGGLGGPMVPFSISNGNAALGQATFTGGQNTLTFGVVNDITNHGTSGFSGTSPTGVRVVFSNAGSLNGATAPEPSTLLMMSVGLVGLGVVARRRRKA